MMMDAQAAIEKGDSLVSALDGQALASRLRAAEKACMRPDGTIDFDWMVMHIWLAKCDAIRCAYQAIKDAGPAKRRPGDAFDTHLIQHLPLFERLVPQVLPLFGEFARTKAIHLWKMGGRATMVAADPAFIARAQEVGLPVSEEDLVYALGPDGPYGTETFRALARHVSRGYRH